MKISDVRRIRSSMNKKVFINAVSHLFTLPRYMGIKSLDDGRSNPENDGSRMTDRSDIGRFMNPISENQDYGTFEIRFENLNKDGCVSDVRSSRLNSRKTSARWFYMIRLELDLPPPTEIHGIDNPLIYNKEVGIYKIREISLKIDLEACVLYINTKRNRDYGTFSLSKTFLDVLNENMNNCT